MTCEPWKIRTAPELPPRLHTVRAQNNHRSRYTRSVESRRKHFRPPTVDQTFRFNYRSSTHTEYEGGRRKQPNVISWTDGQSDTTRGSYGYFQSTGLLSNDSVVLGNRYETLIVCDVDYCIFSQNNCFIYFMCVCVCVMLMSVVYFLCLMH